MILGSFTTYTSILNLVAKLTEFYKKVLPKNSVK